MTAAEASLRFSDLLDAAERGETVTITRGDRTVAEIGPARRRTGAGLRLLTDVPSQDDAFARSIEEALSLVNPEPRDHTGTRDHTGACGPGPDDGGAAWPPARPWPPLRRAGRRT